MVKLTPNSKLSADEPRWELDPASGYAPLWREQLGEAGREVRPAFTELAPSGENPSSVAGTAKEDAVVAQGYGLTRDQHAHVLSTFSHSSYKDAPRQCLAAFDELHQIGFEAFNKKHDPYWNIPLNDNFPKPVIDLPVPATALREDPASYRTGELFDFETAAAGSGALFTNRPLRKSKLGKMKT